MSHWDWGSVGPSAVFWIAIVIIVLGGNFFAYLTRASKHRMLEKLAEKGQAITPEMAGQGLTPEALDRVLDAERDHNSPVQSGIFMMCIGIALAVFFWALGGGGNLIDGIGVPNWLPILGIFPFMIGVAKLIGAAFDKRPPR